MVTQSGQAAAQPSAAQGEALTGDGLPRGSAIFRWPTPNRLFVRLARRSQHRERRGRLADVRGEVVRLALVDPPFESDF